MLPTAIHRSPASTTLPGTTGRRPRRGPDIDPAPHHSQWVAGAPLAASGTVFARSAASVALCRVQSPLRTTRSAWTAAVHFGGRSDDVSVSGCWQVWFQRDDRSKHRGDPGAAPSCPDTFIRCAWGARARISRGLGSRRRRRSQRSGSAIGRLALERSSLILLRGDDVGAVGGRIHLDVRNGNVNRWRAWATTSRSSQVGPSSRMGRDDDLVGRKTRIASSMAWRGSASPKAPRVGCPPRGVAPAKNTVRRRGPRRFRRRRLTSTSGDARSARARPPTPPCLSRQRACGSHQRASAPVHVVLERTNKFARLGVLRHGVHPSRASCDPS